MCRNSSDAVKITTVGARSLNLPTFGEVGFSEVCSVCAKRYKN